MNVEKKRKICKNKINNCKQIAYKLLKVEYQNNNTETRQKFKKII